MQKKVRYLCTTIKISVIFSVQDSERMIISKDYYSRSKEHSVEEVLERPTGYPKVGGSNHGSGDFSLQLLSMPPFLCSNFHRFDSRTGFWT